MTVSETPLLTVPWAVEDFGGAGGFNASGFAGGAFSDIFEDMFGDMMGGGHGRRSGSNAQRGSDLQYNMEISLEEAYKGKDITITVPIHDTCETCSGSGAEAGSMPEKLPDLRRIRPYAGAAGIFHHRAHLPDLRRGWTDDP